MHVDNPHEGGFKTRPYMSAMIFSFRRTPFLH
jgi:hypothetical protein